MQMNFSYLKAVARTVPEPIFNIGIKTYLQGAISTKENMTLDNWRIYKVVTDSNPYFVKIPVIHLTIDRSKFEDAYKVIEESVNCNCEYFQEFGVCKHIVAVCHSLEKEYFDIEGKKEIQSKISDSILSNIFAVENESKVRKLQSNLDSYFLKTQLQNIYFWEQFLFDLDQSGKIYEPFLNDLIPYFQNKNRDFDNEKKVLNLAFVSLRLKGKDWFAFWLEVFGSFSEVCQNKLIGYLFKIRFQGLTKTFDDQINSFVVTLEETQKQSILELLQVEFPNNLHLPLNFVISSKYDKFLLDNLDKFDASLLLDICPLIEDHRERIEIKIMNQIKTWSDFLQVGDYKELEEVLTKWSLLGRSDYFFEAIKHIKATHKKKSSLMGFLRRVE
jgi:SWIM zinc finger